ncbi:MAG: hypothetical protein HOO98_10900 [Nitrospira sp.]|nr:hypothetical protein [Nitrospira sp.]TKB89460.1 MAG: hypothetical protein E8D40_18230 [Nitrospira sp.]
MMSQTRRACFAFFLLIVASPSLLIAAEKRPAAILVRDALTAPGQPATVEAKLISKRLMLIAALGGEPLELVVDGKVVATALTGGDGRAFFAYTPKAQGLAPVHVRIGNSPRVDQAEGQANLAVWEKRQPILVIELSSLIEEPLPSRIPSIGIAPESERKPMAEVADELGKLTQFYYRVIYVVTLPVGGDGFQKSAEARDWLKRHKLPTGYILALPADTNALGAKIDELHASGWKTIKTGVGRSKAFAEAFLQRRLDAIMVPEPTKGEVLRKAKVAKDWKDVRKKL